MACVAVGPAVDASSSCRCRWRSRARAPREASKPSRGEEPVGLGVSHRLILPTKRGHPGPRRRETWAYARLVGFVAALAIVVH